MEKFIRLLIALILIVISDIAVAGNVSDIKDTDEFIILFVNAPKGIIYINNKPHQKNDTFIANSIINWNNPLEYIKAKNLRTKSEYKICKADYEMASSKKLSDYIRKKYTGTKSNSDFDSEGDYLSKTSWFMLEDEVEIPVNLPLGDGTSTIYKFFSIPGNIEIWAYNDVETNKIYITREQLEEKGINITDLSDYRFKVQYESEGQEHCLTLNLQIIYIPDYKY